jgi:pyridoxamine 5'-phosphate oxidase
MDPLAAMRRNYSQAGLDVSDLAPDPFAQFRRWLDEAVSAGLVEPNAMVLATATADGKPSARTVLLKGFDDAGFVFYSNYSSRKGVEIAANPRASLLFPWHALERQVVVEGPVSALAREESAAYFATRPRASRLASWASSQSSVIGSRAELEERYAAYERQWPVDGPGEGPEEGEVPVPDWWGGYRVGVEAAEFWQGRPSRLHDRLRYRPDDRGGWVVERLAP